MLVLYLVGVTVDYISNYDVTSVLEEKTIWATQGESQNNIDRNYYLSKVHLYIILLKQTFY